MSKEVLRQHESIDLKGVDQDGVDPNRFYDCREFCRRLSISRNLSRSLLRVAREAGCIANGASVIASASQLLELCQQIGDESEKKANAKSDQKRRKATKSDRRQALVKTQ